MVNNNDTQRRLAFVAGRRSTLEMDRIMARFLEKHLTTLDDATCTRLIQLLDYPDVDLYNWISGILKPPDSFSGKDRSLLQMMADGRRTTVKNRPERSEEASVHSPQ